MEEGTRRIVLFDGVCNLCDGFVNFVFGRDTERKIVFAPLQSATGRDLCEQYGIPTDLKTVVYIDETQGLYFNSCEFQTLK
jgi:predicted DCC family thiol-disulfide oxidoreductase YuxK